MTIFTSLDLGCNSIHNPNFGVGVFPTAAEDIAASVARSKAEVTDSPIEPSCTAGYTIRDAAWHSGYVLTYDAGPAERVLPPADLLGEERASWLDGQSWAEEQISADLASLWDMDSPENDDAEAEERYFDTLAMCGERD